MLPPLRAALNFDRLKLSAVSFEVEALGPPGTVRFTVNVREVAAPWLPATSVARTLTVCCPSASTPALKGEVQVANAAPSSEHSKVALSFAVNEKDAFGSATVPLGPPVIVTCGGEVS